MNKPPGVELRANLYARSLGARLWLAIPALVTTCAGAAWLSPSPLTLLQAVVGASAGFSAAWYFIGVSEPRALMLYETVPRAAAAVCAVIVAFAFHSVMALLLVQLAGAIGAAALVSQKILRYGSLAKGTLRLKSAYRAVRSGLHAAATSAITSLYVALPVTILAAVDTQAVPNFSAAQRLEWLALALVRPIREYLQGSVPDEDSRVLTKNVWLAARVATICSLALGAVLTVAAAPLTTALTGGAVHLSFWENLLMAVTATAIAGSQVIGLVCLVSLGRLRSVFHSTSVGAAVGLSLVPVLGRLAGSTGAWLALALAEWTVLAYKVIAMAHSLSTRRAPRVA